MSQAFLDDVHGQLGCISCHGGHNEPEMELAHQNMVVQPSKHGMCAPCHGEIVATYENALHNTTAGIAYGLERLAYPNTFRNTKELEYVYQEDCASCHASCGECHVSRARGMGGGVHTEHEFVRRPPMYDSCWGCHGARNAGEYIGNVNGISTMPDVHFQAGMHCADCHDVSNFHGTGQLETSKMDLATRPSCSDCHTNVYAEDSAVEAHRVHNPDSMSCQVCHSLPVANCTSCHVSADGGSSVNSRMQFKIGLNPEPTDQHPWTYVALRHVPTNADMLSDFGDDLLLNFENITSYKMSYSHNIQRVTPQSRSCARCHGNARIFLQDSDLPPDGSPANADLVVREIP